MRAFDTLFLLVTEADAAKFSQHGNVKFLLPMKSSTGRDDFCRRSNADGQFTITVLEGFGVDLLELDCTAHHALLPGVVLGILLELRHHFPGEQFKRSEEHTSELQSRVDLVY